VKRIIIGLVVLLILGGAGLAIASIPSSSGVINGCYRTSGGNQGDLIVIDSAASCPAGYTALDWNQAGPQGPAGISDYEIVTETTHIAAGTYGAGFAVSVTATCSSGKSVLGGGGNGFTHTHLVTSQPNGTNAWRALHRVRFDSTDSPAFAVTSTAICATVN
jgi:hypothetical protein